MSVSLYEISQSLSDILGDIDDGELSTEQEAALTSVEMKAETKIAALLAYSRELVLQADAVRAEIERLKRRQEGLEGKEESICDYVLRCMVLAKLEKVETPLFSAAVCQSPAKVVVEPWREGDIPEPFVRMSITKSLDREKLLELWRQNMPLPTGYSVVRDCHLRVK